ncbi:MAG: MFS transporter [Propionibacteriaceae bacterium]|jgi:MFS family permease|nr:MFS transporter [Propionibacteriaceae bacterium]
MSGLRGLLADTTPLRNPNFRRLWRANIITVVGAQLTVMAVPAQIYADTGNSGYVGLSGIFGLVPLIVFGLWGGALADHFDRRRLLQITTIGLIVTSGLFWLQAAAGSTNVWLLLGIFALQQGFFGVNQPTRTAVLPRILPAEQLPAALSLNMTVMMAGSIAGPMIGGLLIPVLGYSWLYLIDTLTLFATLSAVWLLPPLPVETRQGSPGLRSVIEGFAYLSRHPVLLMSFAVDLIAMIFGMPRALFPQVAHESFGGPIEGGLEFAVLNAAMPVGAVLGGVLSGWVARVRRQGRAVNWAIGIWGVAMFGLGLAVGAAPGQRLAWLGVAFALLAIGGAADMASAAFRNTILLSAADDAVRGRLQGVFIVVVAGGPRIADALHGYVATGVGTAWTIAGGGLAVVIGIVLVSLLVPVFYRYEVTPASVK